MKATILIIGLLLIGVGILGGVWYLRQEKPPEFTIEPPPARTLYTDPIYGFAASFPEELIAQPEENHSVVIADRQGTPMATLQVLESAPGETWENFDAFITATLPSLCGKAASVSGLSCTAIADNEQYWADGASGRKITLIAQNGLPVSDATAPVPDTASTTTASSTDTEAATSTETASDETEETPEASDAEAVIPEAALRGPWYVFNITAASSTVFNALVVSGPFSVPEETIDHQLVESIAQSMVITIITERREVLGFARSLRQDVGGFEVTFDAARWLTGPEAIEAASASGACDGTTPEECLPNGYYIENASSTEESFRLAPEVRIQTVTSPLGEGVTPGTFHDLTAAEFLTLVNDTQTAFSKVPYRIKIISGKVAEITEVYIP